MINSATAVNQVLSQIRAYSRMAESPVVAKTGGSDFSSLFAQSLQQVNGLQNESTRLQTAYEVGDSSIDLPEVMISMQKASLAFEATTEVRNKLLNAYQEIMNMQV